MDEWDFQVPPSVVWPVPGKYSVGIQVNQVGGIEICKADGKSAGVNVTMKGQHDEARLMAIENCLELTLVPTRY